MKIWQLRLGGNVKRITIALFVVVGVFSVLVAVSVVDHIREPDPSPQLSTLPEGWSSSVLGAAAGVPENIQTPLKQGPLAASELRAQEAAQERVLRDERERMLQDGYRQTEKTRRDNIARRAVQEAALQMEQENRRVMLASQLAAQEAAYRSGVAQQTSQGITNTTTGEHLAPAGAGYTSTLDGRYYAPAGPNGLIDTQTGQFITTY